MSSDFERVVIRSDRPSVVVFSASWSRPCDVLKAALLDAMGDCDASVLWAKLDADENPDLSLLYAVDAVPTVLFFCKGVCQGRIVGTATKETILARLAEMFPSSAR